MAIKKERGAPPRVRVHIKAEHVRLAYANGAYTPSAIEPGAVERFSTSMVMLPDNSAIEQIEAAVDDVVAARWPDKASRPKRIRGVHFDPVIKECSKYAAMGIKEEGAVFARAYSTEQPVVVDAKKHELLGAELRKACYSGRFANVTFDVYTYTREKPKIDGVSLGLSNIQLLEHGERLGGARPSADEEFDPVDLPDEDTDADNDDENDEDFVPTPRRRQR